MSEMVEQVHESSQNNLPTAKQESTEEVELAINIPESLKTDTSHTLQHQPVPKKHITARYLARCKQSTTLITRP